MPADLPHQDQAVGGARGGEAGGEIIRSGLTTLPAVMPSTCPPITAIRDTPYRCHYRTMAAFRTLARDPAKHPRRRNARSYDPQAIPA